MLSSLISVLTTSIGRKSSDKAHPFGYGRVEYLSSLAVTILIMFIGITTIVDALKNLFQSGEAPEYNLVSVIIVCASMAAKFTYGVVMRRNGKILNSGAMVMTGMDSIGDGLVSLSILVAIVIYKLTGVDIQYYLCIAISLMIIFSGCNVVLDCITKILGTRIDNETRIKIRKMIAVMPEVENVSNLILHCYGEGRYVGSVDIAVNANLTAAQISKLSRRIIKRAKELGVVISSVGIYALDPNDPKAAEIVDSIIEIATRHECVKQVHSMSLDYEEKALFFYVVPNYSIKHRKQDLDAFYQEVCNKYSDMTVEMNTSIDL
jgi:cation diffusion facilitator family transporter